MCCCTDAHFAEGGRRNVKLTQHNDSFPSSCASLEGSLPIALSTASQHGHN